MLYLRGQTTSHKFTYFIEVVLINNLLKNPAVTHVSSIFKAHIGFNFQKHFLSNSYIITAILSGMPNSSLVRHQTLREREFRVISQQSSLSAFIYKYIQITLQIWQIFKSKIGYEIHETRGISPSVMRSNPHNHIQGRLHPRRLKMTTFCLFDNALQS